VCVRAGQSREAGEPRWADVKIEKQVLRIGAKSYQLDKLEILEARKAAPPRRWLTWNVAMCVPLLGIVVATVLAETPHKAGLGTDGIETLFASLVLLLLLTFIAGVISGVYNSVRGSLPSARYELVWLYRYTNGRTGRLVTVAELLLAELDLAPIAYIHRQIDDAKNSSGGMFFAKIDLNNVYGVQIGEHNQMHNNFQSPVAPPGEPRIPPPRDASHRAPEDAAHARKRIWAPTWAGIRAHGCETTGPRPVSVRVDGRTLWIGPRPFPVERLETLQARESASHYKRAREARRNAIRWVAALVVVIFLDLDGDRIPFTQAFIVIAAVFILIRLYTYVHLMRAPSYELTLPLPYRDAATSRSMISDEMLLSGPDLEAIESIRQQVVDAISAGRTFTSQFQPGRPSGAQDARR
jgi:Family of unknown function (DUF6232)